MISTGPVDQATADDVLREVDVEPTPFAATATGYTLAILTVFPWVIWPAAVLVTGSLAGGTVTTIVISITGGCLWAYYMQRSSHSVAGRQRRARELARRAVDREAVRIGLTLRTADSYLDGTRATIGHTAAWRYCEQVRRVAREAAVRAEARRRVAHEMQLAVDAVRRAEFESRVEQTVTQSQPRAQGQGQGPTHPDHSFGGRP